MVVVMSDTLLPNIEIFIAQIEPFNRLPKKLLDKVCATIRIIYLAQGEQIGPPQTDQD
jgi:CBS domain-containing protein